MPINRLDSVAPDHSGLVLVWQSSVAAARENCKVNGVDNITIVRMSSEEFSDSLLNGVERFRLKEVDLASHDFKTLLVRSSCNMW